MDSKFHLCLLLIILGSLTMQVHSQQGDCEANNGFCISDPVPCPPAFKECPDNGSCQESKRCCCF
ncbi:small cysteine-rich protein 6-like [Oculina patagonica]